MKLRLYIFESEKIHDGSVYQMSINKKRGVSSNELTPLVKRRLPTLPLYAVPSAWVGLTSLFGMGRGGTPTL